MLLEDQHPLNRSIMVSVLGAPNVGKSSMINYFLGTDLSVVSRLPQTTRNKFHCVFTVDHTEVIMVDTPGLHKSNQEINKRMNQQALEGAEGVDLNLLLIDLSRPVLQQVSDFKDQIHKELSKSWLLFTKADLISDLENLPLAEVFAEAQKIIPSLEKYNVISSKSGGNMHVLTGEICDQAQEGPHLYHRGDISNKNERFFATEYIREQAFSLLKDELPYEVAVTIDEFNEVKGPKAADSKKTGKSHISASIHVNRPSQRAIVIGSKGSMIKEIGTRARKRIEELIGGDVHLNLHVKVSPKWFKNNFILEEIGLPRAYNSKRVWRKK